MKTERHSCVTRLLLVCVCVSFTMYSFDGMAGVAQAEEHDALAKMDREAIVEAMEVAATRIRIEADSKLVKRIEKPLFRYDDNARKHTNGSVWAWGIEGRPIVLVTVAQDIPQRWMAEATKSSVGPLKFAGREMLGRFELVDLSGGAHDSTAHLRNSRLDLDCWCELVHKFGKLFKRADGNAASQKDRGRLAIRYPST